MSLPQHELTPAQLAWNANCRKAREIHGAIPGLSKVPGTSAYTLTLPGESVYICIPAHSLDRALRILLKHTQGHTTRRHLKTMASKLQKERHRKEFHHA